MDIETVLHDVNTILLKCGEKDMQEYFIKRYLGSDSITVLEETMKKYGMDYSCDFIELQRKVRNDLNAESFEII